LDMSQLPYVLSALMLVLMFYVFHIGFSCVIRTLSKRRSSMSSVLHRPEMMGLLRTVLPAFHPAFSLFMNGFQGGTNASFSSTWSITMLFAEFELFAFFVATVFMCSQYAYQWYQKWTESENETEPITTNNDDDADVHEGFVAHGSLNTDTDTASTTSTTSTTPEHIPQQPEGNTVWDVANRLWQETNIGSRNTITDDSIYLFPFDVTQTAFYTLHYYFKQQQSTYINKNIVIQSATP